MAIVKVYKQAGESRYAIARIGIRGGVQIVAMQSGRLVVRKPPKFPGSNWVETDFDPQITAQKFLNHSGGTTNTAEVFLRSIAYESEPS